MRKLLTLLLFGLTLTGAVAVVTSFEASPALADSCGTGNGGC